VEAGSTNSGKTKPRSDMATAFTDIKKMEQTALHAHWKLAGWEILPAHAESHCGGKVLKC